MSAPHGYGPPEKVDTSDLVKRLREIQGWRGFVDVSEITDDAADEIERLEKAHAIQMDQERHLLKRGEQMEAVVEAARELPTRVNQLLLWLATGATDPADIKALKDMLHEANLTLVKALKELEE